MHPFWFAAHGLLLLLVIPFSCLAPSFIFGGILALCEGWKLVEGVLYIGGGLVLLPLTDVVPTSTAGIVIDAILACLSLGIFGWLLALIGALPVVTKSAAKLAFSKSKSDIVNAGAPLPLMTILILPVLFMFLSSILGGPLAAAEGWPYGQGLLYVAGIFAHSPALATVAPDTTFGSFLSLVVATYALTVAIGIVVGIYILLPAMDSLVDRTSSGFSDSLMGRLACFLCVVLLGVPLLLFPLAAALGGLVALVEGWDFMTGTIFVGGSFVLLPLTDAAPVTHLGLTLDFIFSCIGVGLFGFFIAFVGALPFVDSCADMLGMKLEQPHQAFLSTVKFFLLVLPLVSACFSVVLGGLLALAEGWSFLDGALFVLSVMIQSPGIAPAAAVSSTAFGNVMIFLAASIGICISIGWGAGLIVASSGLDQAAEKCVYFIHKYQDAELRLYKDLQNARKAKKEAKKKKGTGTDAEAAAEGIQDVEAAASSQETRKEAESSQVPRAQEEGTDGPRVENL